MDLLQEDLDHPDGFDGAAIEIAKSDCASVSDASDSEDAPPQPFSNPLPGYRLLTHQYDTLNELMAELNEYCA